MFYLQMQLFLSYKTTERRKKKRSDWDFSYFWGWGGVQSALSLIRYLGARLYIAHLSFFCIFVQWSSHITISTPIIPITG